MDKFSYAIGLNIGSNLVGAGISELDIKSFTEAIKDVLENNSLQLSIEEAQTIINDRLENLQNEKMRQNSVVGEAFLTENAKKEGVISLASGLQYQVLVAGNGSKPAATDQVKCHYHGTLIDGTVFDSSVQRNQPATFGVNQVIRGWVEALQLMPVGSKWKLFIPSELAYGAQGAGQHIGPNTTLIFEVELLDIV
jgi:FKBP-type peptidyl-prolyl cis-trans isomerase FklB